MLFHIRISLDRWSGTVRLLTDGPSQTAPSAKVYEPGALALSVVLSHAAPLSLTMEAACWRSENTFGIFYLPLQDFSSAGYRSPVASQRVIFRQQ